MSETYRLPETDESHIEEAKHLANRIFLKLTSHPAFEESVRINGFFWLYQCPNPKTTDRIALGYCPGPIATRTNQKLTFVDPPEEFDFPAVSFVVHHKGLYHSAIGPLPTYVWSGNRKVYLVINRFLLNESGQAYREDRLEAVSDSLVYLLDIPNAIRIEKPEESNLGDRINPLEPGDYEMIGYYLNQIDRVN